MTLFEYLAVGFSLVFSFSAMRLVAGLSDAAQPDRRYWIHFCWVCLQLLCTVSVFWAFWSYRAETWTFRKFLFVLGIPGLIYFNACTLIPADSASVTSWRDYYWRVRRRYFLGVIAWTLLVVGAATVVLQMPWTHPARVGHIAILVSGVVGAASSSERVHSNLVLCFLAFSLIGSLAVGIGPDWLRP